jgi:SAM-dependent methyltransferase
MACCTHCCATQTHFDAKTAERDLRQYKRRGVDAVTKLLLSELQGHPLDGRELLDVGAGIGVISCEMARKGIAKATVVEAAPAYLDVARTLVRDCYGARRTEFVLGDFATVATILEDADIVTMGRVVCCYDDFKALLHGASARTRQILAFTYPRYCWYVRAANAVQNLWRWLRGSSFRTYVHLPKRMASVLEKTGLACIAKKGTAAWVVEVYERKDRGYKP